MKQELFKEQNEASWKELDTVLVSLDLRQKSKDRIHIDTFPQLYRKICHDLNIAKANHYDAQLIERLNRLVMRAHQYLYRSGKFTIKKLISFWTREFPQAVRREKRLVFFSLLLFYGISLATFALIHFYPEVIYTIIDRNKVEEIESLYDPASEHFLRPRASETDAEMFGFYIYNNISIGFKVFAGGALLGLGSLFFMVFNSLFLGAVASHLINVGFVETFTTFIIAHGSFELTAIVFTGVAGFKLGWAIIAPGRYKREYALKIAAYNAIPIVYGSAGMLFLAAIIEAFWSSKPFGATIKYSAGTALWILVLLYFLFAGHSKQEEKSEKVEKYREN
jgi:uncharacterized membrane protein SpoIIM required for sporulation